MEKLSFGEFDSTWSKYRLAEAKIKYNGDPSRFKAILKDGKLVTIVSNRYRLIPNEEVIDIALQSAKRVGLKPFNMIQGEVFENVITDNHKAYVLYCEELPKKLGEDHVYLGVGVHNSIDASLGFGVGAFTFRASCKNMVLSLMRGRTRTVLERHALKYIYHRHTLQSLGEDQQMKFLLSEAMLTVMDQAKMIFESYEELARTEITLKLLEKIKKSKLPKKLLPDYVKEEIEVPMMTQWEVYNDLTQAIWHNDKTGMFNKELQFQTLHRAMEIPRIKRT